MKASIIHWTFVKSSNIHACWYHKATKLLLLRFKNSSYYMYHPVSWSTYMGFRRAKSHGEYFAAHIKNDPQIQWQQMTATAHKLLLKQLERDSATVR